MIFLLIALLSSDKSARDQLLKPQSFQVGYLGEGFSAPGTKASASLFLNEAKRTSRIRGQRTLSLNPGIGFFHPRAHHTQLLVQGDVQYSIRTQRGNLFALSSGGGFLYARMPINYSNSNGEQAKPRHSYFTTQVGITLGKGLQRFDLPLDVYLKPQVMRTTPSTIDGKWYFLTELGLSYQLKSKLK